MKLKTSIFAAACAAMFVTLSSCSLDDGVSSEAYDVKVSNLYIPSDPDGEVTFQHNCVYKLNFDYISKKVALSTTDLKLSSGSSQSFSTDAIPFTAYFGGSSKTWDFAGGSATTTAGTPVDNIKGYLTSMVNYYAPEAEVVTAYLAAPMLVMQYKLGDVTVKTFSPNAYFLGETKTTYPGRDGQMHTFESKDAVYRVVFAEDMKKATVVIYNVKFAAEMPDALDFVLLENLDVTLSHDGYTITGTDVTPKMREGSGLTEVPERIFNSFKLFTTSADLTVVDCEYLVSGVFTGKFTGFSVARLTSGEDTKE